MHCDRVNFKAKHWNPFFGTRTKFTGAVVFCGQQIVVARIFNITARDFKWIANPIRISVFKADPVAIHPIFWISARIVFIRGRFQVVASHGIHASEGGYRHLDGLNKHSRIAALVTGRVDTFHRLQSTLLGNDQIHGGPARIAITSVLYDHEWLWNFFSLLLVDLNPGFR